jgi:hypothetical protein
MDLEFRAKHIGRASSIIFSEAMIGVFAKNNSKDPLDGLCVATLVDVPAKLGHFGTTTDAFEEVVLHGLARF